MSPERGTVERNFEKPVVPRQKRPPLGNLHLKRRFVVAEWIEKLHRLRVHDRVEPPGFPFRVDLVQRQGVAAAEQQIERSLRRLSLRRDRKRQADRLLRINRVKLEFRIQFGKLFRFRIE